MGNTRPDTTLAQTLDARGISQPLPVLDPGTTITSRSFYSRLLRTHAPERSDADATLPRVPVRQLTSDADRELDSADFELRAPIGAGSVGEVYVADQRSLRRSVAIKRATASSGQARVAFHREAMIAGNLEHPNIIPIHAIGQDEAGHPVIVMKRIEGTSWGEGLSADATSPGWPAGQLDRLSAHLEILAQVVNAVAFAHSRGVLHRDIKPANVMLGEFGEVTLVDWGIACELGEAHGADELVGTPAFMAPEMVAGDPPDERTDVYLLGATLHVVLTGTLRHPANSLLMALEHALVSPAVDYPAAVPSELAELANRATAANPADRPPTARAFGDALASYQQHRISIALIAAASERLEQLERAAQTEELEPARVYRLASECRFGFSQARAQWPQSPHATNGERRCLEATARFELRAGNLPGARAALAELDNASPELEAAVAAAETTAADDRAERQRLRQMERELDPGRMPRWLRIALPFVGAVMLVTALPLGRWITGVHTGKPLAVVVAIELFVLVMAVIWLGRRHLLATKINRRSSAVLVLLFATLVATRAYGLVMDLSHAQTTVAALIGLAAVTSVAAVTLLRWLWMSALGFAVAGVLSALMPAAANELINASAVWFLVVGLVFWPRARRRSQGDHDHDHVPWTGP